MTTQTPQTKEERAAAKATRDAQEAVRRAQFKWHHDRDFKEADPDCEWCGGWGECGDEFNPHNCSCIEKSKEEREEYERTHPFPS